MARKKKDLVGAHVAPEQPLKRAEAMAKLPGATPVETMTAD